MSTTVGAAIAETLKAYGVTCVFGMEDPVHITHGLDGNAVRIVTVHDEKHGAIMAHGYAKATNRPGVCLATCGPGATNLITGLLEAHQSSMPVIAFVQDISQKNRGRHAASEIDHAASLAPFVKWVGRIELAERALELTRHAFRISTSGRPGPVVVLVAWSIADYLASLEKGVDELLKEKDKREAKAEPKPESKPEVQEAKPKPEPQSKPEVKEAEPKPEPESKPEVQDAKPKPEPQSKPEVQEAKPKPEPQSKPEVQEAKPKPEPQSKPEVKEAEPKPEPESKLEVQDAKPKPEPQSKPEVQEAKPKVEPESKPEVQETKPKPEPQSKPEVKEAEPKPEPESKPEVQEAKTKAELEEPKPGTKS